VINVLSSYTTNHERLKVLRVSLSVIRFLSILNFVYTILGGTFLLLALCKEWTPQVNDMQRQQFFKIGLFVSIFAPLATCVDLMALRGLHSWRRAYLLPWLTLYGFVDVVLFAHALSGIFHSGFSWTYLVLMLCVFCLYSAWRHLRRQYTEMLLDPPTCRTIEQLATDIRSVEQQQTVQRFRENDLPPKYEDLIHSLTTEDAARESNAATVDDGASPPLYSDAAAASTEITMEVEVETTPIRGSNASSSVRRE